MKKRARKDKESDFKEGILLVIFQEGIDEHRAKVILEEMGLKLEEWLSASQIAFVTVPVGEEKTWKENLENKEEVQGVDFNYKRRLRPM